MLVSISASQHSHLVFWHRFHSVALSLVGSSCHTCIASYFCMHLVGVVPIMCLYAISFVSGPPISGFCFRLAFILSICIWFVI